MGTKATVNRTNGEKKHISIMAVVDEYDLRKVISQRTYVEKVMFDFNLQHLEAVLFTNRALTRFRMIIRIFNTGYVCAPYIDKDDQHSLYLKINAELSLMANLDCRVKIEDLRKRAQEDRGAIDAIISDAIEKRKNK